MSAHVLPKPTSADAPKYVGSHACGQCHRGPEMGYQYSKWRRSGHARAYSVLATEQAKKLARDMGGEGAPSARAQGWLQTDFFRVPLLLGVSGQRQFQPPFKLGPLAAGDPHRGLLGEKKAHEPAPHLEGRRKRLHEKRS